MSSLRPLDCPVQVLPIFVAFSPFCAAYFKPMGSSSVLNRPQSPHSWADCDVSCARNLSD